MESKVTMRSASIFWYWAKNQLNRALSESCLCTVVDLYFAISKFKSKGQLTTAGRVKAHICRLKAGCGAGRSIWKRLWVSMEIMHISFLDVFGFIEVRTLSASSVSGGGGAGFPLSCTNSTFLGSVNVTSVLHQLMGVGLTLNPVTCSQQGPLIFRSKRNLSSALVVAPNMCAIELYFLSADKLGSGFFPS